jgi:hypothetical protein
MRLTILAGMLALTMGSLFLSCGSKSGGNSTPEANLTVVTTPATGSDQAAAPGPTFSLSVQITSVLPPQGVTIAISAEVSGTTGNPFYTTSTSSTSAINTFTITDTPAQQTCVVTITVTSKTKASNIWTGSYMYAMK